MKKVFALVLALVLCLSLCACGSQYVCAECGDDFSSDASRYSTGDLCRDCYNSTPGLALESHYCVCGKSASYYTGSTYLCSDCHSNVVNAVQNALGQ